jgi:hypothetical protein
MASGRDRASSGTCAKASSGPRPSRPLSWSWWLGRGRFGSLGRPGLARGSPGAPRVWIEGSRIEGPCRSMTWALWTRRSQMASASVGSPISSCQALTGTWLVMRVDARSVRSSRTSSRSWRSEVVGRESQIVDREEVDLGQAREQAQVRAVAAGDMQFAEEPRGPHAVGGVARAAGPLGERLREPRLPDPRRNSDILRSFDAPSLFTTAGIRSSVSG